MTEHEQPLPEGDIDDLLHRSQQVARELVTSDGRRRSGVETLVGAVEVMNSRYKDLAERMAEVQAELRAERAEVANLREELAGRDARYETLSAQNAKVVREFEAFIEEVGRRARHTVEEDRVIEAAVAMSEAVVRFGDDADNPRPFASARIPDRRPVRRDFDHGLAATMQPAAATETTDSTEAGPEFLRQQVPPSQPAAEPEEPAFAPEQAEERGMLGALRDGFGQLARKRGNS